MEDVERSLSRGIALKALDKVDGVNRNISWRQEAVRPASLIKPQSLVLIDGSDCVHTRPVGI